jgi:P-aminobenzoate N-oxygenase AurF
MTFEQQIERLIKISKNHPLMPDDFVPWDLPPQNDTMYLPEKLTSLYGADIYDTITLQQKIELSRHELAQVMYSYAFGESILCLFLSRYIITLEINSLEYQFILRVLIEEYRHQEMFAKAIAQIGIQPLPLPKSHKILGVLFAKFISINQAFLSSLTIEMIADRFGDIIRKDTEVYPVIQKVSELHNIEEARHILYTKLFLDKRISNAGFIKRCSYSYMILSSVVFMRSMYVKKEIYKKINIPDADVTFRKAKSNYKQRFAEQCLDDLIPFVQQINGFNWATKWLWRLLIKVKI